MFHFVSVPQPSSHKLLKSLCMPANMYKSTPPHIEMREMAGLELYPPWEAFQSRPPRPPVRHNMSLLKQAVALVQTCTQWDPIPFPRHKAGKAQGGLDMHDFAGTGICEPAALARGAAFKVCKAGFGRYASMLPTRARAGVMSASRCCAGWQMSKMPKAQKAAC